MHYLDLVVDTEFLVNVGDMIVNRAHGTASNTRDILFRNPQTKKSQDLSLRVGQMNLFGPLVKLSLKHRDNAAFKCHKERLKTRTMPTYGKSGINPLIQTELDCPLAHLI